MYVCSSVCVFLHESLSTTLTGNVINLSKMTYNAVKKDSIFSFPYTP